MSERFSTPGSGLGAIRLSLPEHCPDCYTVAEWRECEDCGHGALVIDCGHYGQPAEVCAGLDGRPVCDDCARSMMHQCEDCCALVTHPHRCPYDEADRLISERKDRR